MSKIQPSKDAVKFLKSLPAKQFRQLGIKILELAINSHPHDAIKLHGCDSFFRVDSGEYRIIYRVEGDTIIISTVGKRNDDEVYKQLSKKLN